MIDPAAVRRAKRVALLRVLSMSEWDVTEAARRAGLNRTYMHSLIRRHRVRRPPFTKTGKCGSHSTKAWRKHAAEFTNQGPT